MGKAGKLMLTLYRRHKPTCRGLINFAAQLKREPTDAECRSFNKCQCKIWAGGMLAGREVRKSVGTRDWTKANKTVQGWEAEEQITVKETAITLDEAWIRIQADLVARDLSKETIRKYKRLENQMKAFAIKRGITHLNQFDLDTLTQFRATWADKPRSAGKKLERMRAFFSFALDREWVKANYAKKIKIKVKDTPAIPLNAKELQDIYAACDGLAMEAPKQSKLKAYRLKPLLLVMRYAGLRMSDAVQLSKDKISGNAIKIRQAKTGVIVRVPVPPFVLMELAKTPMMTPTRYFWTGNGKRQTATGDYQEMVKEAFDRAGVVKGESNLMGHRFRDTFAIELLKSRVPIARVSKLLGHDSIATTIKHYSGWDESQQEQAEADVAGSWANDPILNPEKLDETKLPRTESAQFQN
jgi:integrase/recombinase XerD